MIESASDDDDEFSNESNLPPAGPSNVSTFLNSEANYYSLIEGEIEEEPEDFSDEDDEDEVVTGEQMLDDKMGSDSNSCPEYNEEVEFSRDGLADSHIYSFPIKTCVN